MQNYNIQIQVIIFDKSSLATSRKGSLGQKNSSLFCYFLSFPVAVYGDSLCVTSTSHNSRNSHHSTHYLFAHGCLNLSTLWYITCEKSAVCGVLNKASLVITFTEELTFLPHRSEKVHEAETTTWSSDLTSILFRFFAETYNFQ